MLWFRLRNSRVISLTRWADQTCGAGKVLLSGEKFIVCKQKTEYLRLVGCGHHQAYSSVAAKQLDEGKEDSSADTVRIIYVDREGERHLINGKVGDNVMYLAQRHDLDVEGACEASLACCTCHVYVKDKYYEMLDEPTEEEEDMLDLAPFLQENSRLSCQIILSKELDGIEVQLPSATRNFYVDGHKPKPH